MAREAMNELRQTAESSLGKILDRAQVTRLKQIELQLPGPEVVLREDMMEKLGIDDVQMRCCRKSGTVAAKPSGRPGEPAGR